MSDIFKQLNLFRFGPIFQTRLVGRPVVMSADPTFNKCIVQQEGRLVEMWYLDTFSKLFAHEGESRTNAAGLVHKYLRNITLSHFGSESLKDKLLPRIEDLARKSFQRWSTQESIDVKESALTVLSFSSIEIIKPLSELYLDSVLLTEFV